jgi:phospholipid transport system substrate-binding protein
MRKKNKTEGAIMRKLIAGLVLLSFCSIPLFVYGGAPLKTVEKRVNEVLDVLRDPALKDKADVRKEKLRSISEEMFNFTELSKRTLSRDWNNFNTEQRKEFISLFRKILENAYMDKILEYSDEKVVFSKERNLSENKVEVETTVVTANAEIPIHYRVILNKDEWMVYDVVIEGISMLKNYRSQFRDILRKKSPEDLLAMLRDKVGKK